MNKIKFGTFFIGDNWKFISQKTKLADKLGLDSVWLPDHLIATEEPYHRSYLESWTVLSALASITQNINIGHMVLCNSFRHPPVLAKMASTLDTISNGRVILGIGAGWLEEEYNEYGIPFGTMGNRINMLSEAVEILRGLWLEKQFTYNGKYYKVKNAYLEPKPIQKPYPKLLIGGGGVKMTLNIVARYADMCNFEGWGGSIQGYIDKTRILENHCDNVGRNINEIERSWCTEFSVSRDKDEIETIKHKIKNDPGLNKRSGADIVGSPDECASKIGEWIDGGVEHFVFQFIYGDKTDPMKTFVEDVLPLL